MYFFDVVSLSAGFIRPASTVSEIIREAMDESFLFNSNRLQLEYFGDFAISMLIIVWQRLVINLWPEEVGRIIISRASYHDGAERSPEDSLELDPHQPCWT